MSFDAIRSEFVQHSPRKNRREKRIIAIVNVLLLACIVGCMGMCGGVASGPTTSPSETAVKQHLPELWELGLQSQNQHQEILASARELEAALGTKKAKSDREYRYRLARAGKLERILKNLQRACEEIYEADLKIQTGTQGISEREELQRNLERTIERARETLATSREQIAQFNNESIDMSVDDVKELQEDLNAEFDKEPETERSR